MVGDVESGRRGKSCGQAVGNCLIRSEVWLEFGTWINWLLYLGDADRVRSRSIREDKGEIMEWTDTLLLYHVLSTLHSLSMHNLINLLVCKLNLFVVRHLLNPLVS